MGNRATVMFHSPADNEISPVVYLHWNGGPESIYAFLDELDRRKIRTTTSDMPYEAARFVHIVGDFFDGEGKAGGLSLGLSPPLTAIDPDTMKSIDPGDNGVYVVTRHGQESRVVRRFHDGVELSPDEVAAEREAAYQHRYLTGPNSIASTFMQIRPNVSKHN